MKAILRAAAILAALTAAPALSFAATGPGTGTSTYQCAPNQNISTPSLPTGGPYTAASDGIVTGVNTNDSHVMENSGCQLVGVGGGPTLIGRLIGANFNVTTDQAIPLFIPPGSSFTPTNLFVRNCSVSLSAAQGGLYTLASKSGLILGATTTPFTGCTATGLTSATYAAATTQATAVNPATAFLSLTTAQGAAATGDVYLYGYVYP